MLEAAQSPPAPREPVPAPRSAPDAAACVGPAPGSVRGDAPEPPALRSRVPCFHTHALIHSFIHSASYSADIPAAGAAGAPCAHGAAGATVPKTAVLARTRSGPARRGLGPSPQPGRARAGLPLPGENVSASEASSNPGIGIPSI